MNKRHVALLGVLILGACGGGDDKSVNLATLDASVMHNTTDPALREAIEAPIATDPDLRREGNRDGLKPADKPLDGAVPVRLAMRDARAMALKLAGGKLLPTPIATKTITTTKDAITLSGIAREHGLTEGCDDPRLGYDMSWAARLPAALPLYPGVALKDAAGANDPHCAVRGVSFTTNIPAGEVLDFYYSMAKRAGYAIQRAERNGGHSLSGAQAQGSGSFYLRVQQAPYGGTMADLVVRQRR